MAKTSRKLVLVGGAGGLSGVPTHLAHLCEALAGRDDAPALAPALIVVSDENRGGYDFAAQDPQITHKVVAGLTTSLNPVQLWRGWRGMLEVLDTHAKDTVWAHARLPVLLARLALIARKRSAKPRPALAITYHGLPFGPGHRRWASAIGLWLERRLLTHAPAHHLVFLTPSALARARACLGAGLLARHSCHVLGNSARLDGAEAALKNAAKDPVSGSAPAQRRLVMTGRAGYQKNIIAAAPILAELGPDWQLDICGNATQSPALRRAFEQVLTPQQMTQVHFRGPVAQVAPVLAGADCYLQTSRYEGLSIGALEAWSMGLALALSDVDGTSEILAAHPHAIRIDPAQPVRAARAIAALLETTRAAPDAPARIRAAWQESCGFDTWQTQARTLTRALEQPPGPDPNA